MVQINIEMQKYSAYVAKLEVEKKLQSNVCIMFYRKVWKDIQ